MRILIASYEGVRIFSERPYGYKRYIVEWANGDTQTFSGLWYSEKKVKAIIEEEVHG
jgi:hypothetical protein